ncbi:hypothetical protein [Burkholderia stabilis]
MGDVERRCRRCTQAAPRRPGNTEKRHVDKVGRFRHRRRERHGIVNRLCCRTLCAGHADRRDDTAQQCAANRNASDAAPGGLTLFACETETQVEPHDVVTRYQ